MPAKRPREERVDTPLTIKIKAVVRQIPPGQALSYGEVAKRAGNSKAARHVARIMSQNFDPTIPCHRVIRANGQLGGYNRGGEGAKRKLLVREGF